MQSVLQKSEGLISLVYVLSLTSTDLKRDWIQHGSDPVSPVSSKRYFCAYSAHEVDDTIKLVFFFQSLQVISLDFYRTKWTIRT